MAEIKVDLIKEHHEWSKFDVIRPYSNECIVEPEEDESIDSVMCSIQQAINELTPYVVNCPIGRWTGRATTYITVQPIYGERRDEVKSRVKELTYGWTCLMLSEDFDGRVQLMLYTPSPMDRPKPAEDIVDTDRGVIFFGQNNKYHNRTGYKYNYRLFD